MSQKSKTRFMKVIVWMCIGFTAAIIVACYVAAWFGVSTDNILTHTCAVFGGELLLTVVLRLSEDKGKAERGRKEAEAQEEAGDSQEAASG